MNSPNYTGAENSGSEVFESRDRAERPDASSLHVREDVAAAGRCGNVHLPTGRTCTLPARHQGSCNFVGPEDAEDVAVH